MRISIKTELMQYIADLQKENVLNSENVDEWHQLAFNEDYYIIGYFNASEWLKKHDFDVFEAIEIVRNYELEMFGEFTTQINSEKIVNMLVYIFGEQLINEDF